MSLSGTTLDKTIVIPLKYLFSKISCVLEKKSYKNAFYVESL